MSHSGADAAVSRTLSASPALPVVALLVSVVSIQYGASVAKGLFPAVGAEGATALRAGLGALILIAVLRPWRTRPPATSLRPLLLYGASLGAMNLMFYMALRTIPLGVAVALEFSGPLGVAVASSRRISHFAWIGLAAAGLAVLLPLGRSVGGIEPHGALLALAAGGCWALYIVFGQKAGALHGAQTVALGAAVAAVVVFPFGLAHAGLALFQPSILLRAVVLAVLSSALPYSLEMVALTRMPARAFGTLMSLEPAVGALMGLLVLHEALAPIQWLAIAAIVVASIGTTLTVRAAPLALPD